MLRLRWAVAALIGGCGLLSGCASFRDHPWFSRARPAANPGCCDAPTVPIAEGPMLDGGPPFVPPPGAELQAPGNSGPLRPQAQPVPAPPASRRTPGLIMDRFNN